MLYRIQLDESTEKEVFLHFATPFLAPVVALFGFLRYFFFAILMTTV